VIYEIFHSSEDSSNGQVVMLCSDAVGYQCFRGLCYLHLHPEDGHSMVSTKRTIFMIKRFKIIMFYYPMVYRK